MTRLEQIKRIYEEIFAAFDSKDKFSEIDVTFYPYIGVHHTIRSRNGKVFVRISEICRDAPPEVQKALAFILVSKLLRKKISAQILKIYRAFVQSPEIQAKATENKRRKGRKIITTSSGEVYDLNEIFARLNAIYFQNSISRPTLTWSQRKTFRILGHHDSTHETIVISKSLDDKKIPPFVVEFVVFHEMLHIFHPTIQRNNRRYNHTPQFRRDEKKFTFYDEAEKWIERNVKNLKRRAKRKM